MTLLRVLLKGNIVPPPTPNVRVVQEEKEPAKEDDQILDAPDPGNYDWEGYRP